MDGADAKVYLHQPQWFFLWFPLTHISPSGRRNAEQCFEVTVKIGCGAITDGIGQMLYPYNEGALVDDVERRDRSWFPSSEPSYPSRGSYTVFPNMLCSQFMCYLFEGHGLYLGAHDAQRGVKSFDFTSHGTGLALRQRLYSGVDYGENFVPDYPMHWCFFEGDWQDGADIYRAFVEANLPPKMKKITENEALPAWYQDSPLVVAYPVRGVHDMDDMQK